MAIDGMKAASILPMNKSLTVIGENNKVSIVLLSFSPTKLCRAIIIAFKHGISKNIDPRR